MTLTARTMTSTTRSGSTTTTHKRLRWSWHQRKDEFVDDKVLEQGEEIGVWQMREEEANEGRRGQVSVVVKKLS